MTLLGRNIFAVPTNPNVCVQNMEDTILVRGQKIDSSKNIFIDRDYFDEISKKNEINNVIGKYRRVWDKQDGKCYICKNKIDIEQEKTIMYKKGKRDKSTSNMAYIHKSCEDAQIQYVKVEDKDIKDVKVKDIIKEIIPKKNGRKRESKFIKLTEYFHNLKKNKVTLKFSDIEKITGVKLCDSAYKYRTYFTNKQEGSISENWIKQGYKISKIDLENKKISFERVEFKRTKVVIPKFLYRNDLPMELVNEMKTFLLHIQEKYRLS